ncbi:hypothetical protein V8687_19500 [Shewanella baltica]|uniref:hypothetical protein n=1 Tax=Shewanella baltica TaxID=62322 RepID=UPI0030D588C0
MFWIGLAWIAMPIFVFIGVLRDHKCGLIKRLLVGVFFGLLVGFLAGCALAFEHWFGYTVFWILFAFSGLILLASENVDTELAANAPQVLNKYQSTLPSQGENESTATPLKKGRLPKSSQKSKSYATTKQSKQVPVKKTVSQETSQPSKARKRTHYSRSEVKHIAFDYIDSSGSFTSREVAVNSFDGTYLKAYCLEKRATRTFKLENICGLITLRETGELLSTYEWEDVWRAA